MRYVALDYKNNLTTLWFLPQIGKTFIENVGHVLIEKRYEKNWGTDFKPKILLLFLVFFCKQQSSK
jgi:hypothetical protein